MSAAAQKIDPAPRPAAEQDPATPAGVAALNAAVTQQAATIAYLNDFRLMMYVVLLSLPLLLLLRRPARVRRVPAVAAAD